METTACLIPLDHPHISIDAFSHKGLVRENNEDNCLIEAFQTANGEHNEVILAAVADGVGGHKAGEIASRIAVDTIHKVIANYSSLDNPGKLLTDAFEATNREIVGQAMAHEEWNGMGTTCVCALVINSRLYVANLGDSRLYLVRDRAIYQLTYDHTWMEEFSAAGLPIDRSHPLSHVLNRYLGSVEPIQVDRRIRSFEAAQNGLALQAGDVLALTSDGISDLLSDDEIRTSLSGRRWERAARRLIYNALKKGGRDNATAVILHITLKTNT